MMVDITSVSADSARWTLVDISMLAIVAIGVVVEGVVLWLPHKWRETRIGLAVERTGWLLVVLGLAGEFVAQRNKDSDDAQIIEALHADNLSLERIMTPRHWLGPAIRGAPTAEGAFEMAKLWGAVAKYAGTEALICVVPDFEAERLANEVFNGLKLSGWRPRFVGSEVCGIASLAMPEGVEVWTRKQSAEAETWDAAESLVAAMAYEGINDEMPNRSMHHDDPNGLLLPDSDIRKSPPVGSVVILVGMKPATLELWQLEVGGFAHGAGGR